MRNNANEKMAEQHFSTTKKPKQQQKAVSMFFKNKSELKHFFRHTNTEKFCHQQIHSYKKMLKKIFQVERK